MSLQTTTLPGAAPAAPAPAAPTFTWGEDRVYFEPDALANNVGHQQSSGLAFPDFISAINALPLYTGKVFGWPNDKDWPAGAGAAVIPIPKKIKNPADPTGANIVQVLGICYWPIWPVAAFMGAAIPADANADGLRYLQEVIYADQAERIMKPLRKQDPAQGYKPAGLAETLKDHIEGMATDTGKVKVFTELMKIFLPRLQGMGPSFRTFNVQFVRSCLSSAAFARAFNAPLETGNLWITLLDNMEAQARAEGKNPDIFVQWRTDRNQGDDIDFSAIDLSALAAPPVAAPVAPTA